MSPIHPQTSPIPYPQKNPGLTFICIQNVFLRTLVSIYASHVYMYTECVSEAQSWSLVTRDQGTSGECVSEAPQKYVLYTYKCETCECKQATSCD